MAGWAAGYQFLAGDPFAEDPWPRPARTPLWREALFALDWLSLRSSPVYAGFGVPRGMRQPVVTVPGFLASDLSLAELFGWLGRIGYRPYFSEIGRNGDCPDHLTSVLLETLLRANAETGVRPALVGHSLGGMLARSVAPDHPDLVSGVVCLASPFRDAVRAHPVIISAAAWLRRGQSTALGRNVGPSCFSGHCTCTFVRNMLAPAADGVKTFAIYSKRDGVVEWESCREDDPCRNDEVNCTHMGMAFHPDVFRVIGRRLAEVFAS